MRIILQKHAPPSLPCLRRPTGRRSSTPRSRKSSLELRETHALNVRLAIIAREKRESARRAAARRAREKARRKKAVVNPLQALWDANGRAIYDTNQAFREAYGKEMDAATRRKAIKDATRNGHFNAGAYAGNLVKAVTPPPPNPYAGAADRIRAAANEIDDEKKIGYQDSELPPPPKIVPYTSGSLIPATSTPPRRLYSPPPPFGPPYPYRGIWYDVDSHSWKTRNKGLIDIIGTPKLIPTHSSVIGANAQLLSEIVKFIVPKQGTLSVGISAARGMGVYGSGSIVASIDQHGDYIIGQASLGGGGMAMFAGEITPLFSVTNAPTIHHLEGWTVNVGASIEDGISLGYDKLFFKDAETGIRYTGGAYTLPGIGVAAPFPVEGHGGASYTWSDTFGYSKEGNIYDLLSCRVR